MLFIELALIRWLGANVLYLAYFSNVVLLGSFLGIGLGFLWTSRGRPSLFPYAPAALATLIVLVRLLEVKVGIAGGSLIFFGLDTSGPPRWVILPVVFVAAAAVMTCIGDGVARAFGQLANLDAYQLDLVGSLLGIAAVALLAVWRAEPIVWGAIAAVGLFVAIRPRASVQLAVTVLPLLFALGFLFAESSETDTRWTPYYKVHTVPIEGQGGVVAEVNGIPTWLQISAVGNPIYETVYDRISRQDPGDVLIIGAGSGNDVAVANARGASRVDAVEIDGDLLDLGREHPDRPYDDPRVVTHVADGRAFLEQTDREWDTILLALPDSLTLLQGQSSVRLESYLFTKEAVESYRDHLAPGGTFAMYNYYREPWLVARYAGTLEEVFGNPPCVSTPTTTLSVLVASTDPAAVSCPDGELFTRPPGTPDPATDDHPFPYLRVPGIPGFYLGLDRRHAAAVAGRRPRGRRAAAPDAPVRRPVLHGRRLPAPRDEERRPVRPALRHDVVRQRPRLHGRAGLGAAGGGDQQARGDPAHGVVVRLPPRQHRRQLARTRECPARAALPPPARRRRRPRLHADLRRQPRVRQPLP